MEIDKYICAMCGGSAEPIFSSIKYNSYYCKKCFFIMLAEERDKVQTQK